MSGNSLNKWSPKMFSASQSWVSFNLQYFLTDVISDFDFSEIEEPNILECIWLEMSSANQVLTFFDLQYLLIDFDFMNADTMDAIELHLFQHLSWIYGISSRNALWKWCYRMRQKPYLSGFSKQVMC